MHVEEKFNSYSHLLGAALALVGTLVLVTLAARLGDPWRIGSFVVYGMALVGQYMLVAMVQNSLRLPLGNDPRGLRAR